MNNTKSVHVIDAIYDLFGDYGCFIFSQYLFLLDKLKQVFSLD